jgi:hypothetical protein
MIRTALAGTALGAALLSPCLVAAGPASSAVQAAAQVTAADAAAFVGDWTMALEGPNGPATFDLSIKVENDKVTGQITGGTTAAQPFTSITKADQSLLLGYSFDYEGNPVDAVVRLTPAEGKMSAQIDFAGGAYVMTGSATKKDKGK